jgi:hypothetical protein
MKLNSLKKISALATVSAVSLGVAVAGPSTPAPTPAPIDSGSVPPPPPPSGGGGGLFDSMGMTLSAGYDTDYIWRGYDLGHDFAWTALDLSIPLGDSLEASLGVWYTDTFDDDSNNEVNYYASLGQDFGAFGVEIGYTHYAYPDAGNGPESNEAYISAGTTVGPLDVSLAYYHDFDLEVSYVEAAATTSIPLSSAVSLDPSVGISYADIDDAPAGVEDSGFNHFFARLDLSIQLTDSATLTPYVATSSALDVAEDFGEDDYLWGGVSLSVDF